MLINKIYTEGTEIELVRGCWIRRILELSQKEKNMQQVVVWLFAVMVRSERVREYLKERELEGCLVWKMAMGMVVGGTNTSVGGGEEERVGCGYRTLLEILSGNINYCGRISKEEMKIMVEQC